MACGNCLEVRVNRGRKKDKIWYCSPGINLFVGY
jgi:hypothetical protein